MPIALDGDGERLARVPLDGRDEGRPVRVGLPSTSRILSPSRMSARAARPSGLTCTRMLCWSCVLPPSEKAQKSSTLANT